VTPKLVVACKSCKVMGYRVAKYANGEQTDSRAFKQGCRALVAVVWFCMAVQCHDLTQSPSRSCYAGNKQTLMHDVQMKYGPTTLTKSKADGQSYCFLDRLDLRYTSPRMHCFAEPGEMPES